MSKMVVGGMLMFMVLENRVDKTYTTSRDLRIVFGQGS